MNGLAIASLGSSPLGLGAPQPAPRRAAPPPSTTPPVAPRLDPVTGLLTSANGTLAMADGLEQRIVLALRTRFGSSVVGWLGHDLHRIDRITDNHQKRVETAVRKALRHLTDPRTIELLSITLARVGPSATHLHVTWRDPATPQQAARTLEIA